MSAEEKERVRRQAAELGVEGLQKKTQELEKAIQHNEVQCSAFLVLSECYGIVQEVDAATLTQSDPTPKWHHHLPTSTGY